MQLLAIPPHAHDIHQPVEHCIGVCKGHVTKKLNHEDASLANMSHAAVQQTVIEGAMKFDAHSWQRNMHKLVQCLRILSTDQDTEITVTKKRKRAHGNDVEEELRRKGTNGNYAYKDFS